MADAEGLSASTRVVSSRGDARWLKREVEVYLSSVKVFADLGLPSANRLFAKAKLTADILTLIRRQRLSYTRVAAMVGLEAETLQQALLPDFDRFSVRRLTKFRTLLETKLQPRLTQLNRTCSLPLRSNRQPLRSRRRTTPPPDRRVDRREQVKQDKCRHDAAERGWGPHSRPDARVPGIGDCGLRRGWRLVSGCPRSRCPGRCARPRRRAGAGGRYRHRRSPRARPQERRQLTGAAAA
jgi:predicted XRE-type DNA-binding protein